MTNERKGYNTVDPTRRGFLQGLVASVSGVTALVTLASPAEALALAKAPVVVHEGTWAPTADPRWFRMGFEVYMRDYATKQLRYLGDARSLNIESRRGDLTQFRVEGFYGHDHRTPPIDEITGYDDQWRRFK